MGISSGVRFRSGAEKLKRGIDSSVWSPRTMSYVAGVASVTVWSAAAATAPPAPSAGARMGGENMAPNASCTYTANSLGSPHDPRARATRVKCLMPHACHANKTSPLCWRQHRRRPCPRRHPPCSRPAAQALTRRASPAWAAPMEHLRLPCLDPPPRPCPRLFPAYVQVRICKCKHTQTHTHRHTHNIYIYIYIYIHT